MPHPLLHHTHTGPAEAPPVLFLHGFMGAASDWSEVIVHLAGPFRCLAIDLPGHGASMSLPEEMYTMGGTAHALLDLLDHLNINRCAVVGYSMGGRLALYFALHFPERCSRLVLESASPGLASEAERAARRGVDEERVRRLETNGMGPFLKAWYRQPLFASLAAHPGLVERMIASRQSNDPQELAQSLRGMGTGRQPSLWERLSELSVATLAMAGGLDAKYIALARQMAARSRCLRAVAVPQAGHNVHAEAPRCFLRLLHTFLKPKTLR